MREAEHQVLENQIGIILTALKGRTIAKTSPIYETSIKWVKNFPTNVDKGLLSQLKTAIYETFGISEAELIAAVEGVVIQASAVWNTQEDQLREILPKGGWFEWYDSYTSFNESPLSYHIFCSLSIIGAALGRRVWLDMGFFKIYPNFSIVLVGPTGRVKKTSATDIAVELIKQHAVCPVLSDAATPESLFTALMGSGHHVIHAGELSTFLGKQRYNEGMIPKLLRVLDSPDQIEVLTQARGKETVIAPSVTLIAATTPGQLLSSMPLEVTSAGFMNRILFILEKDTDRVFPIPKRGPGKDKIDEQIHRMKGFTGQVHFSRQANEWYDNWYRNRRKYVKALTDDTQVEAVERLPGHMLRTAMLIHLVQCDNFTLCDKCLQNACDLLLHMEKTMPNLISGLKQAPIANEAEFVLDMLNRLKGAADHSTLLRRCATKMNATSFKQHIKTLEESGRLKVSKRGMGTFYVIHGEENEL